MEEGSGCGDQVSEATQVCIRHIEIKAWELLLLHRRRTVHSLPDFLGDQWWVEYVNANHVRHRWLRIGPPFFQLNKALYLCKFA
jgi:hypothetical protein